MFPPDRKCNREAVADLRFDKGGFSVQAQPRVAALPTRGVRGHAPPGKFFKMDALRCVFVYF